MSSPLGPLPSTSPSTSRSHRRRTSALSGTSGDESYYRPASVRSAHTRLAASVSGTDTLGSPVTTHLSLDGSSTPNGEYDAEVEDSEGVYVTDVDRVRAPTKSSLSKRREKTVLPQSSAGLTRRAGTPAQDGAQRSADERLGLSRIPRAAVTHAASLYPSAPRVGPSPAPSEADPGETLHTPSSSPLTGKGPAFIGLSPHTPGSASRPAPGSAGKSSRMIDALQTELESTKAQLERAKVEVRNCRREIGTLTRRSEDLRETRDRMRGEAESLNNVISRKERMIADVLSRARTAEAAVAQHTSERKDLETRTKKAVADAAAEVVDAVASRDKAESESDSLRDSVRSLRKEWGRQVTGYRDELSQLRADQRAERESVAGKSQAVLDLVEKQAEEHKNLVTLVEEVNAKHLQATQTFEIEVKSLRGELSKSVKEAESARYIARTLAAELARLRRLARQPPRPDLEAIIAAEVNAVVSGRDLLESDPDHPSIITPAPTPPKEA
ncbi:hypothetical protein Q8F55_005678 [Vanrija albida]|uniref:SWI5-dependent HO expression protein 3 n=1 Tax=Vanrija albida TaxID=181172 RepID=A0ABR3Q297_9TREE